MNHRVIGITALLFFLFFSVIGATVGIAEFPPPEREIGIELGNETTIHYNHEEKYIPDSDPYTWNVSVSEEPEFRRIEYLEGCREYTGVFDFFWWTGQEYDVDCEIVDEEEGTLRSENVELYEEYEAVFDYTEGDSELSLTVEMGMFKMMGFVTLLVSVVGVLLVAGANILGSGMNIPHSFLFSLIVFFSFSLYMFYLVETMFTELPLIAKAVSVYPMLILLVYSGLTEIRE